jgi:CRP-like cAMP-binding protein
MANKFVQFLLRGHSGRAPKSVRDALQIPKHARRRKNTVPPKYIKIVRNGYYARIKIPTLKEKGKGATSRVNATHSPIHQTAQIKPPVEKLKPPAVVKATQATVRTSSLHPRHFAKWFRSNIPVLMLNFGSICILVGFSRSDILELRSLTMTGQLTFAAYNLGQANILWPSVLWSMIFASVNGSKIWDIFHERTAEVHMTAEQERIFVDYFMDHGVTPKQFSWVEENAETNSVKQGETLIQKGDIIDRVFLVLKGSTHAHILGQRLTAASSSPQTRGDQLEGGDSGAWIGEMAFLDWFYRRHEDTSAEDANNITLGRGVSMYTIIADEDCEVMVWTHEAMEELMEKSTDLRAALARAMTAAVFSKIINLTIENADRSRQSWITWLTDWRRKDGSRMQIEPGQ